MNILHKLGLYRASEIDNILKWATEVSCTADKVIEEAKSVKERYRAIFAMLEADSVTHWKPLPLPPKGE